MDDEELFRRFSATVLRFFLNKVQNPTDADDLAQQTFERVFSRADPSEPLRSPGAFVLGVAHNVLREYWRAQAKRRRHEDIGALSIAQMGAGLSTLVNASQWQRIICDALRSLRLDHQTVLELHYWEGKKYREIADILGVPEGTVATWLHAGKRALHDALQTLASQRNVQLVGRDEIERCLLSLRELDALDPGVGLGPDA